MINSWTVDEKYYYVVFKFTIPKEKYSLKFIGEVLRINEKHKMQKLVAEGISDVITEYLKDAQQYRHKKQRIGFKFPRVNDKLNGANRKTFKIRILKKQKTQMINCWSTDEDCYYAVFKFTISKKNYGLEFIKAILLINEKHKMQKLICEESSNAIEEYLNDLNRYDKNGRMGFKFTQLNSKTYEFKYNVVDNVFFYDEHGAIIEKETELLGGELRKIYGKEESKSKMGLIGPVYLWNPPFLKKEDSFTFYIQLHSDIYFPVLLNVYKMGKELYPNQKFIDNTELAKLNTTIFNNWFRDLSTLVKNYNGEVSVDEKAELLYDFKIDFDETGIVHNI